MLRLSQPRISEKLGGWALVDSPPQRTAAIGRHWSFVIVSAAAVVAMASVVFDIRLPTDVGGSAPLSVATALPAVSAPPPPAIEASSGDTSPSLTSTAASAPQRPKLSSPEEATSTATAANVPTSEQLENVLRTSDSAAGESEAASAVSEYDDPASRIRDYAGLHAGAQLPVSFAYQVEAGDTASSIAARFGLDEATVLFNNFDIYDADHLTVGQRLVLPSVDGLVYTVQAGDALSAVLENFAAELEATLAFPANGISSPEQIYAGQRLLLVHGAASLPAGLTRGGGSSIQSSGEPIFLWPLAFDKISDPFGTPRNNSAGYHTGVDFVAAVGTIVGATAAGQVTVATWDSSYGNWVEIDHGGGYRSRYAHLNEIFVREGEWVGANAFIGTVGNTGYSTGAHLHFEIIVNGQAQEPLSWLNQG